MNAESKAKQIFKAHGGQLRMSEALRVGISRWILYRMVDRGLVNRISRGVYRLAELPEPSNPDLVTVALRSPQAVICLVSALWFHELTSQIPHEVWIAIPRDARPPDIKYPPIRWFEFSAKAFCSGINIHAVDNTEIRVYNPEKTIADCFKYRNKIGMDIVKEAVVHYMSRGDHDVSSLFRYAEICRVANVIRPYIETLA